MKEKYLDQDDIAKILSTLAESSELIDRERTLMSQYRDKIRASSSYQREVTELKGKLSLLAIRQQLSASVVELYLKLSQSHLDRGRRGTGIWYLG